MKWNKQDEMVGRRVAIYTQDGESEPARVLAVSTTDAHILVRTERDDDTLVGNQWDDLDDDPRTFKDISYAFPSSTRAESNERPEGCYFVDVGVLAASPGVEVAGPFDTVTEAEAVAEAMLTIRWWETYRRHPLGGSKFEDRLDTNADLPKLPPLCCTINHETGEPIWIRRGVAGYFKAQLVFANVTADEFVAEKNEELCVSKAQVSAMEAGSMFGWECPGANPDHYDEDGQMRPDHFDQIMKETDAVIAAATTPPTPAPKVGDGSPWGMIDHVNVFAEGIVKVSTASHGGIWLSDGRLAAMPQYFKDATWSDNGERWYEEDSDWTLVAVVFPGDFKPKDVAAAEKTIRFTHGEIYERFLSETTKCDRAGEPYPHGKPVCKACGSDDVTRDALATWSVKDQCWELAGELDSSDCNTCGGETTLEWVAVKQDDDDEAPETDPENIHGSASMRQSVEEDRA